MHTARLVPVSIAPAAAIGPAAARTVRSAHSAPSAAPLKAPPCLDRKGGGLLGELRRRSGDCA
eukprot:13233532-Alexandrium_andersonii.AAC.1